MCDTNNRPCRHLHAIEDDRWQCDGLFDEPMTVIVVDPRKCTFALCDEYAPEEDVYAEG